MNITSILRPRTLAAVAVSLVLAASAYGFAAANTVSPTALGDGSQEISGYIVSNVKYTLSATSDPSTVTTVTFDLAGTPAAKYAKVQLVAGAPFYVCDISGTTTITATCDVAGDIEGGDVDVLHIVASSDLLP